MNDAVTTISLVADVGGTNTRVGLCDGPTLRANSVERFKNAEFYDLGAVLRDYLANHAGITCDGVCVAVAGPVQDEVATLTNLDWHIDHDLLRAATGASRVAILNDLQAQGHGIAHVSPENLIPILAAKTPQDGSSKIVIGVGTGFNIAPVYQMCARQLVTASESGHIGLPVQSEMDLRLSQFIGQTHGFADVEEALSGRGVENIYAWHGDEAGDPQRRSAAEIFQSFEDESDPRAHQTAQTFARILGAVAGDLALIHLPFGGVFFSGGVARAFGPYLDKLGFLDMFRAKGRFANLMDSFDIHIIDDDFAALMGCTNHLDSIAPN